MTHEEMAIQNNRDLVSGTFVLVTFVTLFMAFCLYQTRAEDWTKVISAHPGEDKLFKLMVDGSHSEEPGR